MNSFSAPALSGMVSKQINALRDNGFRLVRCMAAVLVMAGLHASAAAEQPVVRTDVPYVPTPPEVVERMLQIAEVKPESFVMDVGCGDGRMVVTAAEKFGARGLGVDINPVRIDEATANAQRAGVQDKVEFRVGDLFKADLSQADVLAIYLLNDVNLRLRPRILETMKPGARVVSHAFHMAEWNPDHHETVDGRNVYMWVVPARVGGRWKIQDGERTMDLNLDQKFQHFTGKATVDGRNAKVRDGVIRGNEISFVLEPRGGEPRTYQGRVIGDRIEAAGTSASGWQATRAAR